MGWGIICMCPDVMIGMEACHVVCWHVAMPPAFGGSGGHGECEIGAGEREREKEWWD